MGATSYRMCSSRETALFGQPLQHGHRAGQHRSDLHRQLLPRKRLALAHLQLTLPRPHLAEEELHQGVRVIDQLDLPGLRRTDHDAKLLLQLTPQGLRHGLSRLQLAPGELPVTCIDLARRA